MGIIGRLLILQNIKERKNMYTSSKTQALDESYSNFRKSLGDMETEDLEILLDAYTIMGIPLFEAQIKAIKDELEFRNTSLGKELL
jgi:hypothetical protein